MHRCNRLCRHRPALQYIKRVNKDSIDIEGPRFLYDRPLQKAGQVAYAFCVFAPLCSLPNR